MKTWSPHHAVLPRSHSQISHLPYFGSSLHISPLLPIIAAHYLYAFYKGHPCISIPSRAWQEKTIKSWTRERLHKLSVVNPGTGFQGYPFAVTHPCITHVGQSLQGTSKDTEAFRTAFLASESDQALNAAHKGLAVSVQVCLSDFYVWFCGWCWKPCMVGFTDLKTPRCLLVCDCETRYLFSYPFNNIERLIIIFRILTLFIDFGYMSH